MKIVIVAPGRAMKAHFGRFWCGTSLPERLPAGQVSSPPGERLALLRRRTGVGPTARKMPDLQRQYCRDNTPTTVRMIDCRRCAAW